MWMARDVFVLLLQRLGFYQLVKSWGKKLIWGVGKQGALELGKEVPHWAREC